MRSSGINGGCQQLAETEPLFHADSQTHEHRFFKLTREMENAQTAMPSSEFRGSECGEELGISRWINGDRRLPKSQLRT